MNNEVTIEVLPIKLGTELDIKNIKDKIWRYKYTVREDMKVDYNDVPQGLYMMIKQNFKNDYDYLLLLKDGIIIKVISL